LRKRSSQVVERALWIATAGWTLAALACGPARADNAVVPDLPANPGLRGAITAPLQLEVFINGRSRKIIAEFRRLPDNSFAATRSELKDAGINAPGGRPDDVVRLDSLAGLKFRYDESKQAIYLDLPEALVAPQMFSATQTLRASGNARTDWGASINFDAFGATSQYSSANQRLNFGGASLSLDGRAFSPYGTLLQSGVIGTTAFNQSSALRLDTTWEYLDDKTLTAARAGDAVTSGLPWTRPIRIGGIQVAHDFGLRPDLVTIAAPTASGTAALPSSVDVYVNNYKIYTQEVDPGPFRIDGLPTISGSGSTSVVLHDVTGKEITQTLPFFVSSRLLKGGLMDYSVEAGYARTFYGIDSFSYDKNPIGSASLRAAFNDQVTFEGHAEGGDGLVNGGAGFVLNALDRGVVQGAVAGSHYSGGSGFQLALAATTAIGGIVIDAPRSARSKTTPILR
jgi:outer membrane usher protein